MLNPQSTYSAQREFYLSLTGNLRDIIFAARRSLKPLPYIPLSEWVAENRYIKSTRESPYKGKWNPEFFPFLNDVMDWFNDDETEEITFMGSAQVGKTEVIKNVLAYYASYDPQNTLLVEPTQDLGRAFSIDKFEPMVEANPELFQNLSKKKSRDSANTHLHKTYLGGSLNIVGANSPNDLSARSKKIVLGDDVDRMPASAGEEGDPMKLAGERVEAYRKLGGFKIGNFSTPTEKKTSRIKKRYDASDQRKWYMPCPFCFELLTFEFDNLYWEKDTGMFGERELYHANISEGGIESLIPIGKKEMHHPETAKYMCEHCGTLIEEVHKVWMMLNGKAIPKFPERIKHKGLHINRLYSRLSTWEQLVNKYLDALSSDDSEQDYKVFINTTCAEVYEEDKAKEIEHQNLVDKVEDFATDNNPRIPDDVLLISSGVDVHPDRLEINFVGWGIGREPFILYKNQLFGDVFQNDVWEELDEELKKKWTREDGLELTVGRQGNKRLNYLCFVDAGDGNTSQAVYLQTRKRQHKGVIAIKGRSAPGKHILINRTWVGEKRDTILRNINVDAVKDRIFKLLNKTIENKPGYSGPKFHFTAKWCDEEYFEGLTSEKPVPVYDRKLGMTYQWRKKSKHARNEPLDILVYAWAAMESLIPNFEGLKENLKKKAEELKAKAEEKEEEPQEKGKQEAAAPAEKKKKINFIRRSKNWVTNY